VIVFATSAFSPAYLFIYLTIWGFILWTLYLLISASASTAKMIFWIVAFCKGRGNTNERERTEEDANEVDERGYEVVSWGDDRIAWYQKVQWVFYQLGPILQIAILLLYWSLLFHTMTPAQVYNAENFNVHMTGGVMAVVDIIANGIPISIYHVYIPFTFGVVYSVFTGVYYAAGGTDPYGNPFIYPTLNYEAAPGASAGIVIAVTFLFLPLLHVGMYALSCFRRWLSYHLRLWCSRKFERSESNKHPYISASNPLTVDLVESGASELSKMEMSGLR
jgi:hypothetical protein